MHRLVEVYRGLMNAKRDDVERLDSFLMYRDLRVALGWLCDIQFLFLAKDASAQAKNSTIACNDFRWPLACLWGLLVCNYFSCLFC